MRPTCAAGWAPRRPKWMLPTALARRAGATSSRLGFPASTGRSSLCLSRVDVSWGGNETRSVPDYGGMGRGRSGFGGPTGEAAAKTAGDRGGPW
jgi:hypothetical protein